MLNDLRHDIVASHAYIESIVPNVNANIAAILAEVVLAGNALRRVEETVGPERFDQWCLDHLVHPKTNALHPSTINAYMQAANIAELRHHTRGILALLGVEACKRNPFIT